MKLTILSLLLVALSAAGCASAVENTPLPPAAPSVVVQVQAQITPTLARPPAKCQSKLTGRVLDGSGRPIQGATVQISGGGLAAPISVPTDDGGGFGFGALCAGKYSFMVALPGQPLKPIPTTATVDGSNWIKLDLTVK